MGIRNDDRVSGIGKTVTDTAVASAQAVWNAINNAGFPAALLPWLMDQAAYETAGFSSAAFLKDNNASGIMPSKYAKKGQTMYAGYATLDAWATDMKRVISMGPAYPVQATSLADYVHRLKQNDYFEAPEAQYLKGLQAESVTWKNIESLYQDSHTSLVMPAAATSFFKQHPLATGIVVALAGILVLKAVTD